MSIVDKRTKQPFVSTPIIVLQDFYERALPTGATDINHYDRKIIADNDLHLSIENAKIKLSARGSKPQKFDKLRPVLRTIIYQSRESNQNETLLAMIKRNLNVPELSGPIDKEVQGEQLIEAFVNSCIPPQNRKTLSSLCNEPILPCTEIMTEWYERQLPATRDLIESYLSIWEKDLTKYEFMIKKNPKPTLESSALKTYSALQTILFY